MLLTLSACHNVGGVVDDGDGDGFAFDEDCDDQDFTIHPGADEVCDGLDNDCDGQIDEDAIDASEWAVDFDGDGFGDQDAAVSSCSPVEGTVEDATDCDDSDPEVNPAADEIWYDGVDQDCDGASDYDQDADGHDSALYEGDDCDDTDASISPSAEETWYDGIDSDCDGADDYDQDGDGFQVDGDCDDTDAGVFPGAEETWYDGVDADCDGASDYDQDLDGFDSSAHGGDDCDDLDANVNPGVEEIWYDGVDQDCDGASDYDRDADGYDSDAYGGDDCNDGDAAANPGAEETWYDGIDSDCDGASDYDADLDGYDSDAHGGDDCDDADAAVNPGASETWYDGVDGDCDGASDYDQDGDGYDSDAYGGDDCDDRNPDANPSVAELCDGDDNDCDGLVDEDDAADAPTWYADADGDGYGDPGTGATACSQPSGTVADGSDCDDDDASLNQDDADADGYSTCEDDCDDAEASTNPGAEEIADDGVDNDCDGEIDNMSETWVVTTTEDFLLGGIDGNGAITSYDDGELQLAYSATGFTSSSATESLPYGRSSMGVVAAGGFLYSVGGTYSTSYSSGYADQVASAMINTDGSLEPWDSSLESLPTGTTTVALATDGHCLVSAGGYTSGDNTAEEVYTAELLGDGSIGPWQAQAPLSSGRSYSGAAAVRGYVYLIGGQDSSGTTDEVSYAKLGPDCAIDSWSSTTSLPYARYGHAVTAAEGHIYVVGGNYGSGISQRVYRATPNADGSISSWNRETDLPRDLYYLGAAVANGYLIIGGGDDGSNTRDETYYAGIAADGSIGAWGTGTASLSGDRRMHALVAWDGFLYQVGGRSDHSSYYASRSATVQVFELTLSPSWTALQTGFSYVFDLGAELEPLGLEWDTTAISDGVTELWYRLTSDGGSAGSWSSAGTDGGETLSGTARWVEIWVDLSSASGDGSTLDEIRFEYRD
jgi:hypothetical protein